MKRRSFLKKTTWSAAALTASPLLANGSGIWEHNRQKGEQHPKLSLAQWSLHRHFFNGQLDPVDFATIAINDYDIHAVEYVNQFYVKFGEDEKFWLRMKNRADSAGVRSLLIMVDNEGDLGSANEKARIKSVENHFKWVNAAKILGCHSIRVNAFGANERETFRAAMVDSLGRLAEYGSRQNINIIIENHGLFSSNAKLITEIIKQVNQNNLGTIPDFGNWCLSAKWGSTQGDCKEAYDRYQGVAEFLPFAKACSAKSYHFNDKGDETIIDYYKMIRIVKNSGYNGHIGIEYEGDVLSEHDGILATKTLIEKAWSRIA